MQQPWTLLSLALLAFAASSEAADHPCASVAEAEARLACYDRVFPPKASAPVASQARPQEDFGLPQREIDRRRPDEAKDQLDEVAAEVTNVANIAGGQRLLTLDNGQVWRIIEGGVMGPLRAGDKVVVRRGVMNSYRIVTPAGVGLRARRVR